MISFDDSSFLCAQFLCKEKKYRVDDKKKCENMGGIFFNKYYEQLQKSLFLLLNFELFETCHLFPTRPKNEGPKRNTKLKST